MKQSSHLYPKVFKPLADKSLAVILLLLFAWVIVLLALFIWIVAKRPIFFVQLRTGKNGRLFRLYKFRTMLSDGKTIFPFGDFMRRTSLDELPQLWNITRGDMSFVGPRPLLPEYVAMYSAHQAQRLKVAQGLTGLAQLAGYQSIISWNEKLALDVKYMQEQSFTLDLLLLFKTFYAIFFRKRVQHNDLSRFEGNDKMD